MGGGGGGASSQGAWGMCFSDLTPWPPSLRGKGENLAGFSWPGERLTPKTLADPQLTRLGNGGGGGTAPSQGVWEMCPHKFKRGGESPTLATRPRGGPKTQANPKPTGVGKWGVQGGEAPMAGGYGGCPPTKPKEGTSCPH
jgi:hypothetical protein